MKRRTLLGLGMLALVLGLSACGSKEKSSAGEVKQEADSGKEGLEVHEEYFDWDGDEIIGLSEEGRTQAVIVIPKKTKSIKNFFNDPELKMEELYFESDEDFPDAYMLSSARTLKKIVLPKNQTSEINFSLCYQLESIDIPAGVSSISDYGFMDCTKLQKVNFLGNQMKTISLSAFMGCQRLEEISLPESIETIEASAFQDCKGLKEVHFSKNLKNISDMAFANAGTESFYFPKEIKDLKISSDSFSSVQDAKCYVVKGSWLDKNYEKVFGSFGEKTYYDGE